MVSISVFSLSLMGRCALYFYLYFGYSERGSMVIKSSDEWSGQIKFLYEVRFANNLFDFVMITAFYFLILKMINFWDLYFYQLLKQQTETPLNETELQVQS